MVSVIIPNYNREKLIKRAVLSVLSQTYTDVEVIVVDDGSTDGSINILKEIEDSRLRIFKLEKNSGACMARNKGISESQGEYIAFLDSDDEWLPYKLEKQIEFMKKENCDAVFTQYFYHELNKNADSVEIKPYLKQESNYLGRILYANCVAMDTLLVKRKVFEDLLFDRKLPRYQDWDIAIQIANRFTFQFMEMPTLNVYEQPNSITYSTSKEKKYKAVSYLYNKYHDLIDEFPKAKSHFLWTMGLYSLCTFQPEPEYIKMSIEFDKSNIKKRLAYMAVKCGGGNLIGKLYARKH